MQDCFICHHNKEDINILKVLPIFSVGNCLKDQKKKSVPSVSVFIFGSDFGMPTNLYAIFLFTNQLS